MDYAYLFGLLTDARIRTVMPGIAMTRVFWGSLFEHNPQWSARVMEFRQRMLARGDELLTSYLTLRGGAYKAERNGQRGPRNKLPQLLYQGSDRTDRIRNWKLRSDMLPRCRERIRVPPPFNLPVRLRAELISL